MTIQKLETAVSKSDLIPFISSNFIFSMERWLYGAAMKVKLPGYETSGTMFQRKFNNHSFKEMLQWLDMLHRTFPQKAKKLYRLMSVPKSTTVVEGKVMLLQTGNNVIQSWTDNVESAVQFYKDVYKGRPEKGKQYVIVQTFGQPLTDTRTIERVAIWVLNNVEKYKDQVAESQLFVNKAWINSWKQLVKNLIKRLNMKMIQSQREQIVYVPKPIKVKIVKVME